MKTKILIVIVILCSIAGIAIGSKKCIYGIDLSHHNKLNSKDIQVLKNKHDIKYVYLKVSEGTSFKDPKFNYYYRICKQNKLLIGGYHFYRDDCSPEKQFNNFIKASKNYKFDLIPVIDFEEKGFNKTYSKYDRLENLRQLALLFWDYYGVYPIIYCSPGVYYLSYPEIRQIANTFWISGGFRLNSFMLQKQIMYNEQEIDFNSTYSLSRYKLNVR